MRILLIKDDQRLSSVVKRGLEESGFAVDATLDGEEGQYLAETESYDVIVLDRMLPKIEGVEICRYLRKKRQLTPILMLTAKSNLEDKVVGLDSGADDYVVKPFEFVTINFSCSMGMYRGQFKVVEKGSGKAVGVSDN